MSGVRGCPMCGSGNAVEAVTCWVCGAALAQGAAPAPSAFAKQREQTDSSTQTYRILGWVAFLLGIFFICTLVAVELALEWPGLLIPFAVITLIVFSALGRIAYVQLKKPAPAPQPAAGGGAANKGSVTGTEVIQGVAMGLALAGAIIAGMMLLFVAAMVIFFLICLAMVAGMS